MPQSCAVIHISETKENAYRKRRSLEDRIESLLNKLEHECNNRKTAVVVQFRGANTEETKVEAVPTDR